MVGPRSNEDEKKPAIKQRRSTAEPKPLPIDPIPFNFADHHTRYRRQSQYEHCNAPDSVRHVLFMLDTSSSIYQKDFENMTRSLSKLVRHFCRPTKIAVMVFNDRQYLEFCFNCFDNNCTERRAAEMAIKNIRYRAGLTYTASATQCACEAILTPSCGFSNNTGACLDVIYITDGQSNDPNLDICRTVECLHDQSNADVKVYAFGIGNDINRDELECITRSQNYNSWGNRIFRVPTIQSFSEVLESTSQLLQNPATNEKILYAVQPNGPVCITRGIATSPGVAGGIPISDEPGCSYDD